MRINFLGGPGSSKSTTAAWLFSELKTKDKSVELVTEYVKSWATQKRVINAFDQVYLFGKQMQYEYRFLNHGIKNIITDSPLILSCVYADYYYKELGIGRNLLGILDSYDKHFDSVNIYLNRKDKKYHEIGRYQNYEAALEIDGIIKDFLELEFPDTFYVDYDDRAAILDFVLKNLDN